MTDINLDNDCVETVEIIPGDYSGWEYKIVIETLDGETHRLYSNTAVKVDE